MIQSCRKMRLFPFLSVFPRKKKRILAQRTPRVRALTACPLFLHLLLTFMTLEEGFHFSYFYLPSHLLLLLSYASLPLGHGLHFLCICMKPNRLGINWFKLMSNTLVLVRKHKDNLRLFSDAVAPREGGLSNIKTLASWSPPGSCKFCSLLGFSFRTGGFSWHEAIIVLFLGIFASLQLLVVLWTVTENSDHSIHEMNDKSAIFSPNLKRQAGPGKPEKNHTIWKEKKLTGNNYISDPWSASVSSSHWNVCWSRRRATNHAG